MEICCSGLYLWTDKLCATKRFETFTDHFMLNWIVKEFFQW